MPRWDPFQVHAALVFVGTLGTLRWGAAFTWALRRGVTWRRAYDALAQAPELEPAVIAPLGPGQGASFVIVAPGPVAALVDDAGQLSLLGAARLTEVRESSRREGLRVRAAGREVIVTEPESVVRIWAVAAGDGSAPGLEQDERSRPASASKHLLGPSPARRGSTRATPSAPPTGFELTKALLQASLGWTLVTVPLAIGIGLGVTLLIEQFHGILPGVLVDHAARGRLLRPALVVGLLLPAAVRAPSVAGAWLERRWRHWAAAYGPESGGPFVGRRSTRRRRFDPPPPPWK